MTLNQAIERSLSETVIALFLFIMVNGFEGIDSIFTLTFGFIFVLCVCKFTTLAMVAMYEQKRKRA